MDKQPQNTKERVVKTVKAPPATPLKTEEIFPDKQTMKPNYQLIKQHLADGGIILKSDFITIIQVFNKIIKTEANVLSLIEPVVVVGDLHGQFYDFIKLLNIGGSPEEFKYLFLGDYVDRGSFSIEILILLYALKINYPKQIVTLRGNHETRQMTTHFNFRDECMDKYDQEIFDLIMESFDLLPLVIYYDLILLKMTKVPLIRLMNQIQKEDVAVYMELRLLLDSFKITNYFQYQELIRYKLRDIKCIIEIVLKAFHMQLLFFQHLTTVIHIITKELLSNLKSVPFIAEKVSEILLQVIRPWEEGEALTEQDEKNLEKIQNEISVNDPSAEDKKALKHKIRFIGKMALKMHDQTVQKNNEIKELKGANPDSRIRMNLLTMGFYTLNNAIDMFNKAKIADSQNEMRPGQISSQQEQNTQQQQ